MHSISSYFIKCFDASIEAKNKDDKYALLGHIGKHDAYEIIKTCLVGMQSKGFKDIEKEKQIHAIDKLEFNDDERIITGLIKKGKYGIETELINAETKTLDYVKTIKHADTIRYFFLLYIPKKGKQGIALLQGYSTSGIKTVLSEELNNYFNVVTGLKLQINPLFCSFAFPELKNALVAEIRLTKYGAPDDIADGFDTLQNKPKSITTNSIIKTKDIIPFGKLQNFFDRDTEEYKLIEICSENYQSVKVVSKIGGKKKAFTITNNPFEKLNKIELDEEDVDLINGNPTYESIYNYSKNLLDEFIKTLYPIQHER